MIPQTAEQQRLEQESRAPWKRWGPYLAERQWGTVREDYSPHGTAWEYLPHDYARSRAYRWGEDGLAGISDDGQQLCFAIALWNGQDPILKERLFGLTNEEGNHGEDVKECYYYLDATPSHAYLKMLYKYPQRAFPYAQLLAENRRRNRAQPEYEILDTGIFDDHRYFDVFIEYAQAEPEDILIRITAHNRGPDPALLYLIPQLWFRNTWSWSLHAPKPQLTIGAPRMLLARHAELGSYQLWHTPQLQGLPPLPSDASANTRSELPLLLFTENETNARRLFGLPNTLGYFKDAFHEYLIQGNTSAVNPQRIGTKAALVYPAQVPPLGLVRLQLRLAKLLTERANYSPAVPQEITGELTSPPLPENPFKHFDSLFAQRMAEADEFYQHLQKNIPSDDARLIQRQAFAGMIWSKQFYHYDVTLWLRGDPPAQPPPPPERWHGRNHEWKHLNNADVLSMPDKWEFPWFAAWDLAFHCIPLTLIDASFAKSQLVVLTREWYMHPNGQLPAYEWAFEDVNPPVHAWAAWRVFQIDRKQRRQRHAQDSGDLAFLERVFHKLLLNFTWWVNRKDQQGLNIFQGGFLGLDNIGVFDRNTPVPEGGYIDQADGTSWMAMYCLNLMRIALELALYNRVYEDIATKFFEHFLGIAAAINGIGDEALGLWDESDAFYYDHLRLTNGQDVPIKLRSIVGLIPLFAVETIEPMLLQQLPEFAGRLEWFLNYRPDLAKLVSRWHECGAGDRHLLSLLRGHRMKCLLRRMLDETEFLSPYGVRAVSRYHAAHPYRFSFDGATAEVSYQPAESTTALFGGNSNWRGPVWMPINYLLIESLQKFHHYYGDDFKIECPTHSGQWLTINAVAEELTRRLTRLYLKDAQGQRPALPSRPQLAADPHFQDYLLFYEYFHGDTGRGLGASHQTGWTGLIAKLLYPRDKKVS